MHRRIGILALCAIIGLLPPASFIGDSMPAVTAHATETAKSDTWGEVSWSIDEEGTLTISGTGRMGIASSSYSSDDSPWSYRYDIKRAVIEDGVTNIAAFAFYDCLCLSTVTIADSVTDIEDGAFSACGSLTSVTLPAGLTRIDLMRFATAGN